jgi:hypothetical protein
MTIQLRIFLFALWVIIVLLLLALFALFPWLVTLLISWLPFFALIGVWIFLAHQMKQAGGTANHSANEGRRTQTPD